MDEYPDNLVVAMPPGGLFREYKFILDKRHPDVLAVALTDRAENILARIVFTDDDDNIEDVVLVDSEDRMIPSKGGRMRCRIHHPGRKGPLPILVYYHGGAWVLEGVEACDAYTAAVWVYENAASFGGDATRLALGGDSAGGNLAAAVCLRARDAGYPRICYRLLIYHPVLDYYMPGTQSYRDNESNSVQNY